MTLFERLMSVFKHFTFTRRIRKKGRKGRKKENAHSVSETAEAGFRPTFCSMHQSRQVVAMLLWAKRNPSCSFGFHTRASSSNVEAVITVAFRFLKELERFLFFLYLTWLFLSAQLLWKILWQMIGTEAFTISQVFRRVWSVSQLLVFSDMQIGHCIII